MKLTEMQLRQSVESIASLQLASGLILWQPGGHADPWNHVETAMALDVGGKHEAAELAYRWLVDAQRNDGGWYQYYVADGIEDAKFDANTIAYVATGVWHHFQATGDADFLRGSWPTVERAIDWVLDLQQPTGEIHWARKQDGTPFHYALVTGSASISHSLQCALEIAHALGHDRSRWRSGRSALVNALANHEIEFFAEKRRWAMDWYYPVLTGVVIGEAACARLRDSWDRFVHEGVGVRCVDDHDWITTGETAECAMACAVAGLRPEAEALLGWIDRLRHDDGSYFTGLAFPDEVYFPADERTAYSTAAVVLAYDMLYGTGRASSVFRPTG